MKACHSSVSSSIFELFLSEIFFYSIHLNSQFLSNITAILEEHKWQEGMFGWIIDLAHYLLLIWPFCLKL